MYTTKPLVGRGQLLLRFCRQPSVTKPAYDFVRVEPEYIDRISSPPFVARHREWYKDDNNNCNYDGWEDLSELND